MRLWQVLTRLRGHATDVPDPEEGMVYPQRRYQMLLHSTEGPISVKMMVSKNSPPVSMSPRKVSRTSASAASPRGFVWGVFV